MVNPPDYLQGKTSSPSNNGPAKLLLDGQWCGHGEPSFAVFDIQYMGERAFRVRLPVSDDEGLNLPVVMAELETGKAFAVYDSRKHPASVYHPDNSPDVEKSVLQQFFCCPNCGKDKFQVSVGFEIPSDPETSNDTTWFALAVRCISCEWTEAIYDDETA